MTSPFNVNLPNLGATGVIQDPGLGGVLGQQYNNLAAAIQAMRQEDRQAAQQALNEKYINAQIEHLASIEDESKRKAIIAALTDQAVGRTIGRIQPQDLGEQAPLRPAGEYKPTKPGYAAVGKGVQPSAPQDLGTVRSTLGEAALREPEIFRPAILDKLKDEESRLVKGDEKRTAEKQLADATRGLSPQVASAVRKSVAFKDLPSDAQNLLFKQLAGIQDKIKPEQVNAFVSATKAGMSPKDAADLLGLPLPPGMENFRPKDEADWMQRLITTLTLQQQMGPLTADEARYGFLWRGAQREIDHIDSLVAGGFKPEDAETLLAPFLPWAGRRALAKTEEARQFLDSVEQIAMARAYAQSGANVPESEIRSSARAALNALFDSKVGVDIKLRRIHGWVSDLEGVARRGAERMGKPEPITDPFVKRARDLSRMP